MSTRSMYGVEGADGKIIWSRVHCGGYPEGVGATLLDNYKTPEAVREVAVLGYLSSLGPTPARESGTEAHGRDWGRDDATNGHFSEFKHPLADRAAFQDYLRHSDCDFGYLLTKEGQWIGWAKRDAEPWLVADKLGRVRAPTAAEVASDPILAEVPGARLEAVAVFVPRETREPELTPAQDNLRAFLRSTFDRDMTFEAPQGAPKGTALVVTLDNGEKLYIAALD